MSELVVGGTVRDQVSFIQSKTGNLRAVQLLPGHTNFDRAIRHPGVELDDALSIAEKTGI